MDINYERLEWEDFPSTETPINAENLNHLEEGIAGLYSDRYDMQSNIAYVEDGETASKDYLPNSYLMRGGLFYKVKKTILYGDTFDSGEDGNIEHVDISSQFGSGGGGSTGCVELTQAQYDALSDEAKMLDVIYLITDSPDNYLDEVFGDFATVEHTDTASKAYAVGDYLVYDNKFYLVTDNIAQDDTITPGTNVKQTTVGDEFGSFKKAKTFSSAFDMNDVTTSGMYFANVSVRNITNWPHADGWLFFSVHIAQHSNTLIQIVYGGRVASEAGRTSYIRYRTSGTWGDWVGYRKDVVTDVAIVSAHMSISLAGNSYGDFSIPLSPPSGYTCVNVVRAFTTSSWIFTTNAYVSGTTGHVVARNMSNGTSTGDLYISCLYKRMY